MSEPMSVKKFDKLRKRDFENGAVIREIREALKDRERLLKNRMRRTIMTLRRLKALCERLNVIIVLRRGQKKQRS